MHVAMVVREENAHDFLRNACRHAFARGPDWGLEGSAMFRYFPTNYVWNLSVDLAIEMGAKIGEIEEMCAPLQ